MQFTDFRDAQLELSTYLARKLVGETMNEALTKRAQKLADKWFRERKTPVVIQGADLIVTGCTLAFTLGAIKVSQWQTQFMRDQFMLCRTVPKHIALGYVNGCQLYIAEVDGVPHLCARDTPTNVDRWSVRHVLTPPTNSELFVALERAKALGYLDYLKGQQ